MIRRRVITALITAASLCVGGFAVAQPASAVEGYYGEVAFGGTPRAVSGTISVPATFTCPAGTRYVLVTSVQQGIPNLPQGFLFFLLPVLAFTSTVGSEVSYGACTGRPQALTVRVSAYTPPNQPRRSFGGFQDTNVSLTLSEDLPAGGNNGLLNPFVERRFFVLP